MNKKVYELLLMSSILSISIILVILEIPILGGYLSLELSLVPILIGRRYIGLFKTLLLIIIYPWFSMFYGMGTWIGSIFLILQVSFAVIIDWFFNKKNYNLFGVFITIFLVTIWSSIINVFFIGPLFTYFDPSNSEFVYTYQDMLTWLIVSLIFNPIKLIISYLITWPLWTKLRNSISKEPIY